MSTTKIMRNCGQMAEGLYRVAVVETATGRIVWEMPEFKKNLILNQGMDIIGNTSTWSQVSKVGVAGTGTRPNNISSQTDTASQTGNTITKVGAVLDFTVNAAVGDVIKFTSGEESTITSITDSQHVQVTPSQSVGSNTFVIWKTAQVGLQTEVKRSSTYLTGTGNCGTTITSTQIQHLRTIDFSTEVGLVNYTEVGLSYTATVANSNVFSRILLPAPVAVDNGQHLRLIYQLNITLTPNTPNSKTAAIGGWPVSPATDTNGSEQIQAVSGSTIGTVGTDGTSSIDNGGLSCLDPASGNIAMWVSSNSSALAAFGSANDRTTNAGESPVGTLAAYTLGSYLRDKTGVLAVGTSNRNDLRSMGFGTTQPNNFFSYQAAHQAYAFLFGQAQTKTNTQTLSLTFRFTWGRVLA